MTNPTNPRQTDEDRELIEVRFHEKVERGGADECWLWLGTRIRKGYGRFTFAARTRMATHVALELDGRPKPNEQMCACHTCDNPPCVNPAHLWWGTIRDNARDAAAKGRLPLQRDPSACFFASPEGLKHRARGSKHGSAKLTEKDVRAIKAELGRGAGKQALARQFGASRSAISLIARGKTWTHV